MSWTNDEIIKFLEAYENEPQIWDPKHPLHKDKSELHQAWLRLSKRLDRPVTELKKKKEALMATFRVQVKRKRKALLSPDSDYVYKPSWFAFDCMERFLASVYQGEYVNNSETSSMVYMKMENDTTDECDIDTNFLEESPCSPGTSGSTPSHHTNSQSSQGKRRLSTDSVEPMESAKQCKTMFDSPNKISINNVKDDGEDICDLYGKIVTKKLKMFSEEERAEIMYEIDGVLLNWHRHNSSKVKFK